jgi:hypothetical protein
MGQGLNFAFAHIYDAVRTRLGTVEDEPLPERWVDLIRHLNEKERAAEQLGAAQKSSLEPARLASVRCRIDGDRHRSTVGAGVGTACHGEMTMRARKMIIDASFGPDALRVITQAFDEAWTSIADRYNTDQQMEAARVQLANAMLSVASDGSRDIEVLKHAALLVMRGDFPAGTRHG